jgi:hypothetical protein
VIAGYFGSGAQGHPNQGYLLFRPHSRGDYLNENFPGSVQTQVTGLNDRGVTVGFWSDMNTANQANNNFGFYKVPGHRFHNVNFPNSTGGNSTPPVNQLLGVNDSNIAVGFYDDTNGNGHGYVYSIPRHRFHALSLPSDVTSDTAAAINNHDDIAGFATVSGQTEGFLLRSDGGLTALRALFLVSGGVGGVM